jgi:DNA-directed RNA polymerase specialized sigma24 family protein
VLSTDEDLFPLILAMASGDRTSLRAFIEQAGPVIHAAQLRATGQSVAAAVLTERTLEELWRSAPLYDAQYGSPRAWILAVARLQAVDFVAARRGKSALLKSSSDVSGEPNDLSTPSDPAAALALAGLGQSDREFLVDLWHRGISGGTSGAEARARLTELLPLWAELLSEGNA